MRRENSPPWRNSTRWVEPEPLAGSTAGHCPSDQSAAPARLLLASRHAAKDCFQPHAWGWPDGHARTTHPPLPTVSASSWQLATLPMERALKFCVPAFRPVCPCKCASLRPGGHGAGWPCKSTAQMVRRAGAPAMPTIWHFWRKKVGHSRTLSHDRVDVVPADLAADRSPF